MGKVTYAPGIDKVSGALAKPKKKDGHSCGSYLIATHREKPTQSPNCSRLYIKPKDNYKRSTPVSTLERQARVRFVAVAAAVRTRMDDLSHIAQDQQAFLAQKDQPYGKKTLKAYLWSVCGDAYDAQQG
jgi:hypothetical protein